MGSKNHPLSNRAKITLGLTESKNHPLSHTEQNWAIKASTRQEVLAVSGDSARPGLHRTPKKFSTLQPKRSKFRGEWESLPSMASWGHCTPWRHRLNFVLPSQSSSALWNSWFLSLCSCHCSGDRATSPGSGTEQLPNLQGQGKDVRNDREMLWDLLEPLKCLPKTSKNCRLGLGLFLALPHICDL